MSDATNKALVELLERFVTTIESFSNLRADTYEHALAAHRLEHLELLYTELMRPGQTLEDALEKCPPWPPGSKLAGKSPSRAP